MPAIRMNVVDKGLRRLITRIQFSFFNDGLVPSDLKFTLCFRVFVRMNYVHSTQAHGDPDEVAAKLLSEKYFGGAGVCWKGDRETARKEVPLTGTQCCTAG